MRRYPEADLQGEIISAERHATIPHLTILRVKRTPHEDARLSRIYVFEPLRPHEELIGVCLKADVLALPQNDYESDETGPLVAMEWCIHHKHGPIIQTSPGWSETHSPRQYIDISPPQA